MMRIRGRALQPAVAAALWVAGCGTATRSGLGEGAAVARISLSMAQRQAVEGGVKQMVINPDSAKLSATRAITLADGPAIHVCGYVTFKRVGGAYGEPLPFYLELRETEGKPRAERGQVATDTAKLSKVTFMCRRHAAD